MYSTRLFWQLFAIFLLSSTVAVGAGIWLGTSTHSASNGSPLGAWILRGAIVGSIAIVTGVMIVRWAMLRVISPLQHASNTAKRFLTAEAPSEPRIAPAAFPADLITTFDDMRQRVQQRLDDLERRHQSLDQNTRQLAIVLEAMVEGVIAIDSFEHILFANSAAVRLLDLKAGGLTGRPLWEAVRLPQLQDLIADVRRGGEQRRIEVDVPRTQLNLAAVVSRLPGTVDSGIVIVLHDVTDLRRLENLRREFVSNVSHELKTPLAAISAYAETLLDGALDDPEMNRTFVSRIGEQADRLHTLILELLELGRLETNEQSFDLEPVNVGTVLQECANDHQDVALTKGLRLEIESSADSCWALADQESLRTIADNLLDNAINYTPTNGRITLRWRRKGNWIEFDVQDTGVGIAKENQARIFERFFRVDKARSREVGGTGLGLSIVKHLCQLFGGSVSVSSQIGTGSTFTVKLPVVTLEDDSQPPKSSS